jgi:hypothetical protein
MIQYYKGDSISKNLNNNSMKQEVNEDANYL